MRIEQYCRPTPESNEKQPYLIPLNVSLWGEAGALAIRLKDQEADFESSDNTQAIIELTEEVTELCFCDVPERPVISLLRGFSAPVKLNFQRDHQQLLRLMTMESDGFTRWDACQSLLLNAISELQTVASDDTKEQQYLCKPIAEAFKALLQDDNADPAMVALMLQLPSLSYLIELRQEVQLEKLDAVREILRLAIANACFPEFKAIYQAYDHAEAYQAKAGQIAKRSLKNTALSYLMLAADKGDQGATSEQLIQSCVEQFQHANNMSDQISALQVLLNADCAEQQAKQALDSFYQQWKSEALVVNLWLQSQALRRSSDTLEQVTTLKQHPAYDGLNPNKVRSLIGAFCGQNLMAFHASDDDGQPSDKAYQFLAEEVLALDKHNPQIAARLLVPLTRWHKFAGARQSLMKSALQSIAEREISKDMRELVEKSL